MRLRGIVFSCAFGLVVVGCNPAAAPLPPAIDHDAEGSWEQDTHGALTPENSFVMRLTESSGAITGTGAFAGEAGPYGSLKATGTVQRDSMKLQIVFVADATVFPNLPPDTEQFAGFLINKNQIRGQLTHSGVPARTFDLMRLMIGDPP